MTTDNLNLSSYEEITVDFSYYPRSMDNSSEDFWLQISTNGGSSYTTVEEWNRDDEFVNDQRYFDAVVIPGPFTSNTRLRFRCDASGNSDWVYIDDVEISGCSNSGSSSLVDSNGSSTSIIKGILNLAPNPTHHILNINYTVSPFTTVKMLITDINGKVQRTENVDHRNGQISKRIDVSNFAPGVYILHMKTADHIESKKFVVIE